MRDHQQDEPAKNLSSNGNSRRENLPARDIVEPLHRSSTYEVSWDEALKLAQGEEPSYFYARYGTPTQRIVEDQLLDLCAPAQGRDAANSEYDALVTASGMAAISLVPFALLRQGDEIIVTNGLYGGTSHLFREVLPRFGITTRFVSCDLSDLHTERTPRTRMLWIESPANPLNRLVPFETALGFARSHGIISCIDATLAPPPLQRSLASGFDLEVHSCSKYLGGHSDLLAGAIIGRRSLLKSIRLAHRTHGAVLDADAAFLLGRGMKTLALRLRQINDTAFQVAQWLEEHPAVSCVHYPRLESHPDYLLAQRQMPEGCGGIVAFDLAKNFEGAARQTVESFRHIRHAASLGGTETLVSYPPLSSHAGLSEDELGAAGITRGTLRLAIGLETASEIIEDLELGLGR